MKYSPHSPFWPKILTGYSLSSVSVEYGYPLIRCVGRLWVIAGLGMFLFMNSVYAETMPVVDTDVRPSIQWKKWGSEAFRQAQIEDKLILLDLTAVWCHACHVMDQTTYANPRIIQLLNDNFIPVRVDTDQRPDLEARYRAGDSLSSECIGIRGNGRNTS